MSTEPPPPAETAAELRLIVGQLVRRVRSEADTLSPRLAATLGYLSRDGAMTTSALAARQNVRHQSMAATVKELEAHGFIERHPDPNDGRSTLLALSASGEARLEEERSRRYGWLAETISERLSPDEQRRLADTLPLLSRLLAELRPRTSSDEPAADDR